MRRPEIERALNGGWMQTRRFSHELGQAIEVTAGPIETSNELLALRLELLGRRLDDREAAARELQLALDETDRLAGVVDRLLARDAPDDDAAEQVDLVAAGRAAVERWAPIGDDRGIRLGLDAASVAVAGSCRPEDLQLILDVLLENALKYAPVQTEVTLSVRGRAIEIADAGPGLAPHEFERVFERFYRGTASRARGGGAGLGLPLAREVAERWGARVTLENRPSGRGALARVVLRS